MTLGQLDRGQVRAAPWLDPAAVLVTCAALLVVAAVAMAATRGVDAPSVAAAFCCLIAFGEMVRLRLPDDRMQAPIGLAAALGYGLLSHLPQASADDAGRATHSVLQTVLIVAMGMLKFDRPTDDALTPSIAAVMRV